MIQFIDNDLARFASACRQSWPWLGRFDVIGEDEQCSNKWKRGESMSPSMSKFMLKDHVIVECVDDLLFAVSWKGHRVENVFRSVAFDVGCRACRVRSLCAGAGEGAVVVECGSRWLSKARLFVRGYVGCSIHCGCW